MTKRVSSKRSKSWCLSRQRYKVRNIKNLALVLLLDRIQEFAYVNILHKRRFFVYFNTKNWFLIIYILNFRDLREVEVKQKKVLNLHLSQLASHPPQMNLKLKLRSQRQRKVSQTNFKILSGYTPQWKKVQSKAV